MVCFAEITRETVDAVLALDVAAGQRAFVASNAKTIAQAHFWPDEAWFRAIEVDGELVGLVALAFEPGQPPGLWRLMVDARRQRRGVGRAVMALLDGVVRARCPEATVLRLSHVPGEGDPGPFYERLGFRYTGAVEDGERVMERGLG